MLFILLIILIGLSAFFSGAEIAFISLSDHKVRSLVEHGVRNAHLVQRLKSNPHNLLVTVLIGNNLVNIGASSLATVITVDLFTRLGFSSAVGYGAGFATGIMTLVILLFGEIIPKSYCSLHSARIALVFAPAVQMFYWLFTPIMYVLSLFYPSIKADYLNKRYPSITEDEVRTLVKIGEEEGVIKQEETQIIHNVFEMDDTDVASIMVPRLDMFTMDSALTVREAIQKIENVPYSRIPVYSENLDNIVGVILRKELLQAGLRNEYDKTLKSIMQEAHFVPESTMVNTLLMQFKKQKIHLALVVDEHGGIDGLVTIEDILEELVGEIYDKKDTFEQPIKKIDENTYRVSGKLNISEINEQLHIHLTEDDSYDTLSGLILNRLGHIPKEGESVTEDVFTLTVSKVAKHRIIEVIVKKEQPQKSDVVPNEGGK